MNDIIERLEEYNRDWRTRAGSAQEVRDAIDEIKRLRKELERRSEAETEAMAYGSKAYALPFHEETMSGLDALTIRTPPISSNKSNCENG